MTNVEIIWEDPPERTRTSKYEAWLLKLSDNPGKWARWPTSFAVAPTGAMKKQAEEMGLIVECVSRRNDENKRDLWVSVTGPAE